MVKLAELRQFLDRQEEAGLSAYATRSVQAIRRRYEERIARGTARTSRWTPTASFTPRPIPATSTRPRSFTSSATNTSATVLHVQLLSKIARTIGKFLRLNEDLLEAIALGHDIGHPPFGHDGERILSDICAPTASALSPQPPGRVFWTGWKSRAAASISPSRSWTASSATTARPPGTPLPQGDKTFAHLERRSGQAGDPGLP